MMGAYRNMSVFLTTFAIVLIFYSVCTTADALTITEYDNKALQKRGEFVASTVQKIVNHYESKEEKKHKASCTRSLYGSKNAFGTRRLYSLILSNLNHARNTDPDNTKVENIIYAVTENECSDPKKDRAASVDMLIDQCGIESDVSRILINEKGYEIVAHYDRYIRRDKEDKERTLLSFVLSHPKNKSWIFIHANRPRGYDRKKDAMVLCVRAKGKNMEIIDYNRRREAYENVVTLDIDGKPKKFKQGEVYKITREYLREQWDKLHKLGGRPDPSSKDPYIVEVSGHRIDFREEKRACKKARQRWKEKWCMTYEKMKEFTNKKGNFIAFQAIGKKKNEEDYIISIMVKDDKKIRMLYTTLDGGTVVRELGKNIQFMNSAIKVMK